MCNSQLGVHLGNKKGSQKVPGILWHGLFGAPWVRTAWTVLLCKFCRGSGRQVAGRDSGFCTEPHIACCVITQPPHSPDLAPSDFWLFPALKMGLKGHVSQPWRISIRMRRPNSTRFLKKSSTGASNSCRVDGASVCVRMGPILKVIS
jgi:hypothetical protein